MEIRRSVLVPYSVESMFDLIERAEDYPNFLPWCVNATILERSDDWVAARLEFKYLQVRFGFQTRNPKRRPEWLHVRMVDGPFKRFQGDWSLTPVGGHGCRIHFDLSYEISDRLLDKVAVRAVELVAGSMMDAFVKRAEETLPVLSLATVAAPPAAQALPAVQEPPVEVSPPVEMSRAVPAAPSVPMAPAAASAPDAPSAGPLLPAVAAATDLPQPGVAEPAPAVEAPALAAPATTPPVMAPAEPPNAAPSPLSNSSENTMSTVDPALLEAVRASPLSQELNAEQSAALAAVMRLESFAANEVLAPEDKVDNRLCVIVDGSLSVLKHHGTPDETLLVALKPGDFAHELGFLDGSARYASLVATVPSRVLILEREALESLIQTQPMVLYRVMCAIVRTVHRIQTRLSMQASELTNYIVKQHGRY